MATQLTLNPATDKFDPFGTDIYFVLFSSTAIGNPRCTLRQGSCLHIPGLKLGCLHALLNLKFVITNLFLARKNSTVALLLYRSPCTPRFGNVHAYLLRWLILVNSYFPKSPFDESFLVSGAAGTSIPRDHKCLRPACSGPWHGVNLLLGPVARLSKYGIG